jgi:sirohydrochlorin cobaltochelatase
MDSIMIVLAMHGAPPSDFPRQEVAELFALHGRLEHAAGSERTAMEHRYDELHAKMRAWPRTPQNDRFWAASLEMARALEQETGRTVLVGFNEFCAPSLEEVLDEAADQGAEQIVVLTPMMTRGGEHAEADIPAAIRRAKERHPQVHFAYAWPFPTDEIARFLAAQIDTLV